MQMFTIGYGGVAPAALTKCLKDAGVKTVVDVRLRPDRASMGAYVKAKTSDKGIEKLLADAGLGYRSLPELGNLFLEFDDWQERYASLLRLSGDLLATRLADIPEPYCLLCAERRPEECHRKTISNFLALRRGAIVKHLVP